MRNKTYLKILFAILGTILTMTIVYAIDFSKKYPLPITNRISFDAKIQFIHDHVNTDKIDTIIVGSSLGLNDIQGAYLEKSCSRCKGVLNLSVFEASPVQVEQLLELSDAFPNLERIIYSGQFSDFGQAPRFKTYDPKFIKKYIRKELNPIEYSTFILNACKDVSFCIKRQEEWESKYQMNNKFSYLGFDHTGSVPLHIYGKDIIKHRWNNPHHPPKSKEAFAALGRIAKTTQQKGIKFYFIQQPYRQPLIDKYKHVQYSMRTFPQTVKNIIGKSNGIFFNLYEKLQLSDKYFADRSHLNDQGSRIGAEAIGKFIDENEK